MLAYYGVKLGRHWNGLKIEIWDLQDLHKNALYLVLKGEIIFTLKIIKTYRVMSNLTTLVQQNMKRKMRSHNVVTGDRAPHRDHREVDVGGHVRLVGRDLRLGPRAGLARHPRPATHARSHPALRSHRRSHQDPQACSLEPTL